MDSAEFDVQAGVPNGGRVVLDAVSYAAIAGAAVMLWWLARDHASLLPAWAPWDFSWVEFLATWLVIFWYVRGLAVTPAEERPSRWRRIAFFAGILIVYAVLQTHFEYLAEHQFFFNRVQHVVMHHIGPFLLAVAWQGETLARGLPDPLRRVLRQRLIGRGIYALQQPVLAALLFVGSFFFWLVPPVHFHAMINPRLFALMNWTMVLDGILFWCLVLDPRPKPPARVEFGTRALLAALVIFPQIVGGALIAFTPYDIYSFYALCGRIYPGLGAHYDQVIGGLIIWIPPAMMSLVALLLVVNNWRLAGGWGDEEHCDAADAAPWGASQPFTTQRSG